jgi:uncharacterized protein YqhQ
VATPVGPPPAAAAPSGSQATIGPARVEGEPPPTGRDAPIGGQAVLEGVMMRGVRTWALAVRTPAGTIAVQEHPLDSVLRRHRALRLPGVRGVIALGESMVIGFRALEASAAAQLPEEDQQIGRSTWAGTVLVAVVFAIGLFFVAPVTITNLVKHQLGSSTLFWLVEGLLRTAIFLGYLVLLARVRDLRRVFEYHGAEHKAIACHEAGMALEPESAQRCSRLHPRCGTSFLLVVMIVAIFVFAPLGVPSLPILILTRVLGVPVIAGLSFEIIRFAGRQRHRRWVRTVMWPGMQLQLLTTREPDLEQLAVAIAALQAVLAVEQPGENTADDLVGLEVVA